MKKVSLLFDFTVSCSTWGAAIGFILGIIYFAYPGLWAYGIFGFFINLIVGWILGILNGFVLGLLYIAGGNSEPTKTALYSSSILVTFVGGFIMYFYVFFPLTHDTGRTIVISLIAVIIATFIAARLSQRVSKWYPAFKHHI